MFFLNKSRHNSSNLARVIFSLKSTPSAMLSTSTRASGWLESCRLAFSQARFRRAVALASLRTSNPCFFFSWDRKYFNSRVSKSSPPKWVSPEVATTSKKPSSMLRSDTSNVPPPKSNTRMCRSPFLFSPYAMAAAVGSLMIRSTSSPAMVPASFVAMRCPSLKYAGHVTTAFFTSLPRYDSATDFILVRIMADTSSGVYCFTSPLKTTCTLQLPLSLSSTTLYGSSCISLCTSKSLNFFPINLLTAKMVFWGLVGCAVRAPSPTKRSSSPKPTTEGVIRLPISLGMISTPPFCHVPTAE
mmetsp:Transcript_142462/g.248509  ORF Transcript_142462/g.248509 Transcript_142462/m.248509 type:complete len:300 (+) Transcript_142462:1134-2033(+)